MHPYLHHGALKLCQSAIEPPFPNHHVTSHPQILLIYSKRLFHLCPTQASRAFPLRYTGNVNFNDSSSLCSIILFSSSVPTVILRHPVHPNSPPLYLTTTPHCSAMRLYIVFARALSGDPAPPIPERIGSMTKLASFLPMTLPTHNDDKLIKESMSEARESTIVRTFCRMRLRPSGERAWSARCAVGPEMLYGAFVLVRI